MRRLTVVSVSYPLAPVGSDAAGGAEQVLSAIDAALVGAGHRSLVVAPDGSTVAGELIGYKRPSARFDGAAVAAQRLRAGRALGQALDGNAVDLVHMHGVDFHHYLPAPGPPVLVTLHLPIAWYPPAAIPPSRPGTWLHCVSDSQAASAPSDPCMLPPIGNGVPTGWADRPQRGGRTHCLVIARICPEKGIHLALEAAHAADASLLLGGAVFPYAEHVRYFEERVRPLLDRRRRFVGPLGLAQKRRLLRRARCLLIPSVAAETSSLVAMEAASCGTPVVAFRSGALPEIVEHGRTGLIVDDAAAMSDAIGRVGEIDGATCLAVARARFPVERMTAAYLARYHALTGRRAA